MNRKTPKKTNQQILCYFDFDRWTAVQLYHLYEDFYTEVRSDFTYPHSYGFVGVQYIFYLVFYSLNKKKLISLLIWFILHFIALIVFPIQHTTKHNIYIFTHTYICHFNLSHLHCVAKQIHYVFFRFLLTKALQIANNNAYFFLLLYTFILICLFIQCV